MVFLSLSLSYSSSLTLCVQFWRHGITTTRVSAADAVRFYLNASIMSISYYLCVIFGILEWMNEWKEFYFSIWECRKQDSTSFDRWLFEWVSIQMRHDHVKLVLQQNRIHKLFIYSFSSWKSVLIRPNGRWFRDRRSWSHIGNASNDTRHTRHIKPVHKQSTYTFCATSTNGWSPANISRSV